MDIFHLFSILIVLSAGFAYINFKFIKLPNVIGLMLISLIFSLAILSSGYFMPHLKQDVALLLEQLDFSELLLEGMLSFMLFAGSIHIKIADLKKEKVSIILFSTMSVLISTFLIAYGTYFLLAMFNINVALIHCFLFGALISPTDPIAVLSILKKAGVSKSIETKIAGESLFNDGVAVVIFITILKLAQTGDDISFSSVAYVFGQEAFGGLILGALIGYIGYKLMTSIDNYQIEVMITLAVVMGGYTLAHFIHVSGPLAMVVAGLITGNHGKKYGMSHITEEYIDKFWEIIDEILNALLFVLIGLELLVIEINPLIVSIAAILIVVVLIVRYISVWFPTLFIKKGEETRRRTLMILTWGGLRGGISIALALSIAPEFNKDIWVTITYIIVCFSILVQGTTIKKLT